MFRTLGRFTAKARGMAREFQRAMEAAADETGVKDVAKDLKEASHRPAVWAWMPSRTPPASSRPGTR
jgi:hypothetical protein